VPLYVVDIRPETRAVVIGRGEELFRHDVTLEEVNWLADQPAPGDLLWAQCRYRARPVPGAVTEVTGTRVHLSLAEPVRAVTPGQSGVLYGEAGRVLGGGVIA
jgi:tRNA-specific 2-thiouridylase